MLCVLTVLSVSLLQSVIWLVRILPGLVLVEIECLSKFKGKEPSKVKPMKANLVLASEYQPLILRTTESVFTTTSNPLVAGDVFACFLEGWYSVSLSCFVAQPWRWHPMTWLGDSVHPLSGECWVVQSSEEPSDSAPHTLDAGQAAD